MNGSIAAQRLERSLLRGRYEQLQRLTEPKTHHLSLVFSALDRVQGRRVAIKVLHPRLANTVHSEIFDHEAKCLSETRGIPGVVELVAGELVLGPDAPRGFDEDLPFIVTELGEFDLAAFITSPSRETRRCLELFRQLCVAVKALRDHGVFHRDIKPTNCVLMSSGELKLIDFGSAFSHSLGQPSVIRASLKRVAHPPLCDPRYAAVETKFGLATSRVFWERADSFALGAILFELLSGERLVERVYSESLIRDLQRLVRRVANRESRRRLFERLASALARKWHLPPLRDNALGELRGERERLEKIYRGLAHLDYRERCTDLEWVIAQLDEIEKG